MKVSLRTKKYISTFKKFLYFDAKCLKSCEEILSANMLLVMSVNETNGELINGATEYCVLVTLFLDLFQKKNFC